MSPLSATTKNLEFFTEYLLRFPRELRDLIYTHLVAGLPVFELNDTDILPNITNPQLRQELFEAFFSNVTCLIRHTNYLTLFRDLNLRENYFTYPSQSNIWGAYAAYKPHIRCLQVESLEVELKETELPHLEHECSVLRPEVRTEWIELLDLPRLQNLHIILCKQSPVQFHWANFSPILYELRACLPRLKITFAVSIDVMLYAAWDAEGWEDAMQYGVPFFGSGPVRVTELVEPPSEEDRVYVERYCERKLETKGRNAVEGLLGEEPEQRRVSMPHYVVKEAALARVLMEEHWGVYKAARRVEGSHIPEAIRL